jgi:hypothetical protein
MKQPSIKPVQSPFNKEVKAAYFKILRQAKALLSTIEQEELRFTLIREDKQAINSSVIHEMVNPLLYLRLESHAEGYYSIHYGFELFPVFSQYYPITSAFARLVYKVTMSPNTAINIEEALRVDFIILNCSEVYEHVEERQKHEFKLIQYKPAAMKRKQMKAVA